MTGEIRKGTYRSGFKFLIPCPKSPKSGPTETEVLVFKNKKCPTYVPSTSFMMYLSSTVGTLEFFLSLASLGDATVFGVVFFPNSGMAAKQNVDRGNTGNSNYKHSKSIPFGVHHTFL